MKTRFLAIILIACLSLSLLSGCAGSIALTTPTAVYDVDTTITLSGSNVDIDGGGATLEDGDVLITSAGVYMLTGKLSSSRILVKADEEDEVTLILAGVDITNPNDEGIYIKTAASATIILADGTENTVTSGVMPEETSAEASESNADAVADGTISTASGEIASDADAAEATTEAADEDASGAAIRAKCPLTITGEGSVTVYGYINNGIAANGDLLVESGSFDITAVNDALKSKANLTVTGGRFKISSDMDAVQADGTLDISGGVFSIVTGAGSEGAEVKVSDSSMMGNMGGMGNRGSSSSEADDDASDEADVNETDTAAADEADEAAADETESASAEMPAAMTPVFAANADNNEDESAAANSASSTDAESDASASNEASASREMGGMPGFGWDSEEEDSGSMKGLKATDAIHISGGEFILDTEDDAIHCDGEVTVSGGTFTILSGDDGIHGDVSLVITGGNVDIQTCYEGLEAQTILISDGFISIVASDDGMNANGSGGMMGGMMMGNRGSSGEASDETSDTETADGTTDEASPEAADGTTENDTASAEAQSSETDASTEESETYLRITGGTIIVDAGGDGLDSNGDLYIDGGTIYVSGPSTAWDSPIDYGDGGFDFIVSGGTLMAAGYSAMAESPDSTDASQPSIYYTTDVYAADNSLVTLADADGSILAEYTFAHSYNCVIISTPDITVGETYTLTIDGISTEIEMTETTYSNRSMGGSGEMGGFGGMPGGR